MDGGLWLQARDALAGVAELSRQKGGESIDIYCLNNPKYSLDLHVGHLSSCLECQSYWLTDRVGRPQILRQY